MDNNYKRFQFDFSKETEKRLIKLRKTTEARSNVEIIIRALKAYEFFKEKTSEGYSIFIKKQDDEKLVIII